MRRLRMTGPEIAELLKMASSTLSAVLDRIGLGKLSRLGKRVHVCVDDATRLAYVEILDDEKGKTSVG